MPMSLVYLGSYYGTCNANENMVDVFKNIEKEKNPKLPFNELRKVAIEAPKGTEFIINNTTIIMPSTGHFELGVDWVQISSLIFKTSVDANIIYMY